MRLAPPRRSRGFSPRPIAVVRNGDGGENILQRLVAELDADAFGLAMVEAKYGNVAGTGRFFKSLADAARDVTDQFASHLATHGVKESRIENLWDWAAEKRWPVTGEFVELAL
jgi:predicted Zn-dependent protease